MTVSVIFYFTEAFKITTPDKKGHIENVIAQANIAFLKSEIPLKLSMKCMLETNLTEAPDSTDRIREFRDSRGEMDLNSLFEYRHFPGNLAMSKFHCSLIVE